MRGVSRGLPWVFLVVSMILSGCGPSRVVHHGYAADGYGVIDNSPHLPPPEDLWQHAASAP